MMKGVIYIAVLMVVVTTITTVASPIDSIEAQRIAAQFQSSSKAKRSPLHPNPGDWQLSHVEPSAAVTSAADY